MNTPLNQTVSTQNMSILSKDVLRSSLNIVMHNKRTCVNCVASFRLNKRTLDVSDLYKCVNTGEDSFTHRFFQGMYIELRRYDNDIL